MSDCTHPYSYWDDVQTEFCRDCHANMGDGRASKALRAATARVEVLEAILADAAGRLVKMFGSVGPRGRENAYQRLLTDMTHGVQAELAALSPPTDDGKGTP